MRNPLNLLGAVVLAAGLLAAGPAEARFGKKTEKSEKSEKTNQTKEARSYSSHRPLPWTTPPRSTGRLAGPPAT